MLFVDLLNTIVTMNLKYNITMGEVFNIYHSFLLTAIELYLSEEVILCYRHGLVELWICL